MAGIANFGGKQAAPFGSKSRKTGKMTPAQKRALAKAALAKRGKSASLANPATGREIDLDWASWDAQRRGGAAPPPRPVQSAMRPVRQPARVGNGGLRVRKARNMIRTYQTNHGLKVTGHMDPATMAHIRQTAAKHPTNMRAQALNAVLHGRDKLAGAYTNKMNAHITAVRQQEQAAAARKVRARRAIRELAKPAAESDIDLAYMGFSALKAKLAAKGAANPGALAAYIGRKKYGRAKFAKAAAKGKKLG